MAALSSRAAAAGRPSRRCGCVSACARGRARLISRTWSSTYRVLRRHRARLAAVSCCSNLGDLRSVESRWRPLATLSRRAAGGPPQPPRRVRVGLCTRAGAGERADLPHLAPGTPCGIEVPAKPRRGIASTRRAAWRASISCCCLQSTRRRLLAGGGLQSARNEQRRGTVGIVHHGDSAWLRAEWGHVARRARGAARRGRWAGQRGVGVVWEPTGAGTALGNVLRIVRGHECDPASESSAESSLIFVGSRQRASKKLNL
eukprot:COSAG04_NODE_20_length_39202_cov_9.993530_28_plen_259_part_00